MFHAFVVPFLLMGFVCRLLLHVDILHISPFSFHFAYDGCKAALNLHALDGIILYYQYNHYHYRQQISIGLVFGYIHTRQLLY